MDPNQRLRVFQSSSPSIRSAAAPQPQPNLTVKTAPAQPLQMGGQTFQRDPNAQVTPAGPPRTTPIDALEGAGQGIAGAFHSFADIVPTAVGQLKALTPHPLDPLADVLRRKTQSAVDAPFKGYDNLLQDQGYNGVDNQPVTTGGKIGKTAGDVVTNVAAAADAATSVPKLIAGVKKVPGIMSIAKSSDPAAIFSKLQGMFPDHPQDILEPVAHFLSNSSNPNTVRKVLAGLSNIGNDTKTASEISAESQTVPQAAESTIENFNPSNPQQSQLPTGYHPDASPDPVPVLENAARSSKSETDFENYINGLTGEERAAAESALNGRTPKDFYDLAGGPNTPSDLETPAFQRGAPTTVGEAASQHNLGVDNLDASLLDADKRQINSGEPGSDNLDIPSYIKKDPNTAIKDANDHLKLIDETIAKLGTNRTQQFNAKQELAQQLRDHPENREAIMKLYQHRMSSGDEALTQEHINNLLAQRQKYQHILNAAKTVQGGEKSTAAEAATASDLETPAYLRKQAGQQLAPDLPAEDITAIQKAGGDIPKTNETKTSAGEPTTTPAAPESTKAVQAAAADALPPEHVDAIRAAGGDTPEVAKAKQDIIDELSSGKATRAYNEAAQERSGEKAARSIRAEEAFKKAGGGQAGLNAKLGALKGEYAKSEYGVDLNPETHNTLINEIEKNPNLQRFEKTNAQTALRKLSNTVKQGPTPYDIKILRKAFGDKFGDTIQEAADNGDLGKPSKLDIARQLTNVPKSVLASFDISAPGRQGIGLAFRNPKEFGKATVQMLKYWHSEDNYLHGMAEIASRPTYQRMLDSKLAVTGTEALDAQEEQFASNLAEKIPGAGRIIRKSDRAFTGFLTRLRADVFDKMANIQEAVGIPADAEHDASMAKVINTFSGRGDLGKLLEPHAASLNTGFFSPKLWKSRLDMINPIYYAKLVKDDPQAAKFAFQNAAAFTAGTITILEMAKMAGATVVTDPTNSDFGKIKIDNTRLDITGGLSQNIVLFAREIEGKYTNSQTGDVKKLGSGIAAKDRVSLFGDTVQNKANPLFSAALQIARGKDRGGNPVNPATTIGQLVVPLPFQTFYQSIKDEGNVAKGIALGAPDLVGISSQTYGNIPTKFQGKPDAQGKPTYNGPIKENMVTDENGKALLDKNGKPVTVKFPNGADALTKKAILDAARPAALKDRYTQGLDQKTQALIKLDDKTLKQYVKDGTINQSDYDHIKNIQKTADSTSKGNNYDVPDGASSPVATNYYKHWNSMDAKDQKAWLEQSPDKNSTEIAKQINAQRSQGLDEFKPSNKLAQLYAQYEVDLNTHPEYTELDKRNKGKDFQATAAKMNYNSDVGDIYAEGGSQDLKTLISNKKIKQQDLNDAIALDNQLYSSGLETNLKFSKKFRNEYGFVLPALYGSNGEATYGSGSGSGGGSGNGTVSQQLSNLVMTPKATAVPKFKGAARATPASTIKFRAPQGVIPSEGSKRVTAGPFRTTRTTTLRNSVAE